MTSLTDAELRALRNLANKELGELTSFLNIAAAQSLTAKGLATRSRQGWEITAEGGALLASLGASGKSDEASS